MRYETTQFGNKKKKKKEILTPIGKNQKEETKRKLHFAVYNN